MRQVEGLIVEGIQQSIRSLLPVKTILREYLNDEAEGEEEGGEEDDTPAETEVVTTAATPAAEPTEKVEGAPSAPEPLAEPTKPETLVIDTSQKITSPPSATVKSPVTVTKEEGVVAPPPQQPQAQSQTFVVDTEPSVGFTNMDTVFDSNDVDGNEIRAHSEFENGEVERIETLDAPPEQIDGFEELGLDDSKFEFEEIPQ
jgi:hypothetical protein